MSSRVFLPTGRGAECRAVPTQDLLITRGIRLMVDALISDGWDPATAAVVTATLVRAHRSQMGSIREERWNIDTPPHHEARRDPAAWIRRQVWNHPSTVLSALGGTHPLQLPAEDRQDRQDFISSNNS
jgi:hypothetical protein